MNQPFQPNPPTPRPPLLACHDLTKRYGNALPALRNLNLTLYSGRIVGLLGTNGSGKSTLIKLINGLLTPTSGQVLIHGKPVGVESRIAVSYLPERTYLSSSMSVEKELRFFSDFYPNFRIDRAMEMLHMLGIPMNMKISAMSKGTREKLQLILVMSRDADLYVLDEPIAGVDPAARDYILRTILSARHPGSSILISTHLITDIEPILDDAIFLSKGTVVLAGAANEIRQQNGKTLDQLFREVFRC